MTTNNVFFSSLVSAVLRLWRQPETILPACIFNVEPFSTLLPLIRQYCEVYRPKPRGVLGPCLRNRPHTDIDRHLPEYAFLQLALLCDCYQEVKTIMTSDNECQLLQDGNYELDEEVFEALCKAVGHNYASFIMVIRYWLSRMLTNPSCGEHEQRMFSTKYSTVIVNAVFTQESMQKIHSVTYSQPNLAAVQKLLKEMHPSDAHMESIEGELEIEYLYNLCRIQFILLYLNYVPIILDTIFPSNAWAFCKPIANAVSTLMNRNEAYWMCRIRAGRNIILNRHHFSELYRIKHENSVKSSKYDLHRQVAWMALYYLSYVERNVQNREWILNNVSDEVRHAFEPSLTMLIDNEKYINEAPQDLVTHRSWSSIEEYCKYVQEYWSEINGKSIPSEVVKDATEKDISIDKQDIVIQDANMSDDRYFRKTIKPNQFLNQRKLNEWVRNEFLPQLTAPWGWLALYYIFCHYNLISDVKADRFVKYATDIREDTNTQIPKKFSVAVLMRDCDGILDSSGNINGIASMKWNEYNRKHIDKKDFSYKAVKESLAMLEKVWSKFNVEDFITQPD